ncbi:MAG: hypothetical protein ACI88H_004282, partial [Cocleimonas sp.]
MSRHVYCSNLLEVFGFLFFVLDIIHAVREEVSRQMKNKKINPSPYPSSRESEYGKENAKFSEPGSIKPKIIKNP